MFRPQTATRRQSWYEAGAIESMKIWPTEAIPPAKACLVAVFVTLMIGAGCGGSADPLLPSSYVVPLSTVSQYFTSITQNENAMEDSTAQGSPNATIAVFFLNGDNTQKVTITVDRYSNAAAAAIWYQAAVQKSMIPGFTPITIPTIGQQSFAGTVSQNGETHVGLGAQDGIFVFGVTLAGFEATQDNINNLVSLAQAEKSAINVASGQ